MNTKALAFAAAGTTLAALLTVGYVSASSLVVQRAAAIEAIVIAVPGCGEDPAEGGPVLTWTPARACIVAAVPPTEDPQVAEATPPIAEEAPQDAGTPPQETDTVPQDADTTDPTPATDMDPVPTDETTGSTPPVEEQ